MNKQTLEQIAAALFLLWMILLVPWFLFATVSGMVWMLAIASQCISLLRLSGHIQCRSGLSGGLETGNL